MNLNRRDFLAASAGAILSPAALAQVDALGKEEVASPTTRGAIGPALKVVVHEADGSMIDTARYMTCHARDLSNDPLPQVIHRERHGDQRAVNIALAKEPIQVSYRLKIPQFGEVYCYADNEGHGYSASQTIDFVNEAAATRLRRSREIYELAKREGAPMADEIDRHLTTAAQAKGYASLAQSMHAGEKIAMARAQHRISRFARPRKDFLFGVMVSPLDRPEPFPSRVKELFNFATTSWYTWKPQPADNPVDYARMDNSINWCLQRGIIPKGFGYVYLTKGATPEWIRSWPFEKVLPEYVRVVEQTMRRYAGRLPYAEIMNEAHDKANLWHFSHEQVLTLAREAMAAARRGSPAVKRQMNHCCLWAEYAKNKNADGTRRWSPFTFVRDCFANGVDYEIIGMQLYYPEQDLLEIERMLDRFKVFKKPMHITEIATASHAGLDGKSMRKNVAAPGWHGEWSESTQAEWATAIYTMIYSKQEFEAIGWWDLAETPGHFWPYGGLLNDDLSPKPAYYAIKKLKQSWGL